MSLSELANNLITKIDDAIAKFETRNADDPKYLILSLEYRAALKYVYPSYSGDLDPRTFAGIEIIKKEESIIL